MNPEYSYNKVHKEADSWGNDEARQRLAQQAGVDGWCVYRSSRALWEFRRESAVRWRAIVLVAVDIWAAAPIRMTIGWSCVASATRSTT